MKSVGDIIRRTRERQKKSIQDLAKLTHIDIRYIEAIERNDFFRIPTRASLFGFVDTLAIELGIDAKMLVSIARRDAGEMKSVLPQTFAPFPFIKRLHLTPALLCLIASCLVFGSYAVWSVLSLRRAPDLTIFMPKDKMTVSSPILVRGKTATDASLEIDTQPVAISSDGTFVFEIDLPQGEHIITADAKNRYGGETIKQVTVQVEK